MFGSKSGRPQKREQTIEVMQVSRTNLLVGGRGHHTIGRIKASSGWRAVNAPAVEADRSAAPRALIREAEEYEADAIVGLDFEVDSVSCADIGGARCSASPLPALRSSLMKRPDRWRSSTA
jgi:uncharacterized protein YbjQ (UPF0145 family)